MSEIPKDKQIILYCAVGLRGYIAYRILIQNGFTNVFNLSGGYKTYSCAISDYSLKSKTPQACLPDSDSETGEPAKKEKTIAIDACGLQCPGPIMQLKKNYDKIEIGDKLEIKVTDQAFGEDLNAWCHAVGAKLLDINNSAGVITAHIEKEAPKCKVMQEQGNDDKTIIVFSDDLDKALASFVIANGAASMGKKVTIFFTFWGLSILKKRKKVATQKGFLETMFGWMLPSHSGKLGLSKLNMGGIGAKLMRYMMKTKKVDSLESLIQQAQESGVEFIACSMSMDVMGIEKAELIDGITIAGVAAYLEKAETANVNLFI